MIQKALQYLVGLKENKTYDIEGNTWSDNPLHLIREEPQYRKTMKFGSLDSIVQMVREEYADYDGILPLYIQVVDHKNVRVFTGVDDYQSRTYPYTAYCEDTDFREGWREQDQAIIELRSRFIPTEDSEYLINLISRINNEQGVQSTDNGVSQTVVTKQGVTLMSAETVKPRLMLQPFRTFREVPQPESEFILRLDDNSRVGLFEADGGVWKMEAKDNIKTYFVTKLNDEIVRGIVKVLV